jgi:hypothetical protein
MSRWLGLSLAAIAVAAIFAGCGGEEEEPGTASPAATPVRTGTAAVTATLHPTGTATAGRSDGIPTVPPPVVTQPAPSPTPQPSPTVEPTEELRQPVWTVSQVSGAAAVDIVLDDGLGSSSTIASVDPELVQWENWGVQAAADLNADGIQDVIVFHFTGGAHCCSEYMVFRDTYTGILLDDWFSLGNGGIVGVEDLDGDGVPELEGWDDRLAYFADQPYVASPSLPLVLCRTAEGKYTDCTAQFPERMQAAADEFEASLSDAVQRQASDEEKRSYALGLVTAYLLLAPTDEAWNKVASLCPECKDWLLQNQAELENRLAYVPPAPPMEAPQ